MAQVNDYLFVNKDGKVLEEEKYVVLDNKTLASPFGLVKKLKKSSELEYVIFYVNDLDLANKKLPFSLKVLNKYKGFNANTQVIFAYENEVNLTRQEEKSLIDMHQMISKGCGKELMFAKAMSDYDTNSGVSHCLVENTLNLKQVLHASNFLNEIVEVIKQNNLSQYEQYLMLYMFDSTFKYKDTDKVGTLQGADLAHVLNSDIIVCTGLTSFMYVGLKKLGIPCFIQKIGREHKDFLKEDIKYNHVQNIIYLDDKKYDIKGYYNNDITFDTNANDLFLDNDIDLKSLMFHLRPLINANEVELSDTKNVLLGVYKEQPFKKMEKLINRMFKYSVNGDEDIEYVETGLLKVLKDNGFINEKVYGIIDFVKAHNIHGYSKKYIELRNEYLEKNEIALNGVIDEVYNTTPITKEHVKNALITTLPIMKKGLFKEQKDVEKMAKNIIDMNEVIEEQKNERGNDNTKVFK